MFLNCIRKTREYLLGLYEQDKKSYKSMLMDKKSNFLIATREDIEKLNRISSNQTIMSLRKKHIVKVLKAYLTANDATKIFIEQLFECAFNETLVKGTLDDTDFVLFAMKANLVNRIVGIEMDSERQVKLRIYSAILNYNKLKKELA